MRPALTGGARAAVLACAAMAAAVVVGTAHAGDIKAGKAKAIQCQACHGLDGMSKLPGAPNLAGQVEDYLVKALRDYKTGARRDEQMSVMAKGLSDTDIANLAAYFSSLGKP